MAFVWGIGAFGPILITGRWQHPHPLHLNLTLTLIIPNEMAEEVTGQSNTNPHWLLTMTRPSGTSTRRPTMV